MELLQDFTPTCDLSTFTHPKVSVPSLGWMHPAGVSTWEHWGVCMCEPTQKLSAVLGDQLAQLAQLAQSLAAFYTLFAGQVNHNYHSSPALECIHYASIQTVLPAIPTW